MSGLFGTSDPPCSTPGWRVLAGSYLGARCCIPLNHFVIADLALVCIHRAWFWHLRDPSLRAVQSCRDLSVRSVFDAEA